MPFDASALIQAVVDTKMAEQRPLVPVGEYTAVTAEIEPTQFRIMSSDKFEASKNGCDKNAKRLLLDLPWIIDSPELSAQTGRSKMYVRQSIFLDVTPDSDLDAGRFSLQSGPEYNLGLGRLRKVFNQNEDGKPWSFSMLGGKPARITVNHTISGENEYDQVAKVVAL